MLGKFKISTFVDKNVPPHMRMMQGFKALLGLPVELYNAHLCPMDWHGRPGQRPDKRDDYLYKGTSGWDAIQSSFKESTRLEMHLFGFKPQGNQIEVNLTFWRGRLKVAQVKFSFNPAENEVGAGYLYKCTNN